MLTTKVLKSDAMHQVFEVLAGGVYVPWQFFRRQISGCPKKKPSNSGSSFFALQSSLLQRGSLLRTQSSLTAMTENARAKRVAKRLQTSEIP